MSNTETNNAVVVEETSILGSIWGFLGAAADAVVAAKDYVVEVYEDPNTQKNIELAGVVTAAYAVDIANFTCTVAGYVADAVVAGAMFVSEAADSGSKGLTSVRNDLSHKGAMLMISDEGKAAMDELQKTMDAILDQKEAEADLLALDEIDEIDEIAAEGLCINCNSSCDRKEGEKHCYEIDAEEEITYPVS